MTCINPIFARVLRVEPDGKMVLSMKGCGSPDFALPCGKCAVCLANKRRDWCNRMKFEQFYKGSGTFLTLTYNNDNLPSPPNLHKEDLQKFLKRLRNARRDYGCPSDFTYFAVGEYGSAHGRPHYHLALFGIDMQMDCWQPYAPSCNDNGFPVFASKIVEKIWDKGFNVVGSLTDSSIRYVSKYISKSLSGNSAHEVPEFYICSLGLGRSVLLNAFRHGRVWTYEPRSFANQAFANGFIVLPSDAGYSKVPLPRAFDRYAQRMYGEEFLSDLKMLRREFASHLQNVSLPSERLRFVKQLTLRSDANYKRKLDNAKV